MIKIHCSVAETEIVLCIPKLVTSDQQRLVMLRLGYLIYVSLIKTKVGIDQPN